MGEIIDAVSSIVMVCIDLVLIGISEIAGLTYLILLHTQQNSITVRIVWTIILISTMIAVPYSYINTEVLRNG